MYELKKKMESYLQVNLLGPGPRLMKKRIYRAAVSQRLENAAVEYTCTIHNAHIHFYATYLSIYF